MLYQLNPKGVFDPEIIAVMVTAFDRVCQFFPNSISGDDGLRQQYASKIINLVDQGQRDPERLFDLALYELATANYRASTIPIRPCMTS
jgi:hypothetical protein